MKTQRLPLPIFAAAALLGNGALGQSWQPILDIHGRGHRAIGIAPVSPDPHRPDLIVAGDVSGSQSGLVHRLSQGNSVLTPLDPGNHEFGSYSLGWDLNVASPGYGNLYLAGYVLRQTASGNWVNSWKVRRGVENSTVWEEVDSYSPADAWSESRGLTLDSLGNVYACGMAIDAAGLSHWIVRKSVDQGAHWETQDIFRGGAAWSLTGYNAVAALGITCVPNPASPGGALFVVGTRGKLYAGAWTVTRSMDGGSTWQIVDSDSWVPRKTGTSRARKVVADSAGRIFVLGDTGGRTEQDPSPWVVRMSADGGNTWSTIFGPWNYGPCPYPLDLAMDAAGNVWAVGVTHKKYGTKNVTYTSQATWVRLTQDTQGSWNSTFGFLTHEADGINRASANAVTADAWGGVYVSGSIQPNPSSQWEWFVQRTSP